MFLSIQRVDVELLPFLLQSGWKMTYLFIDHKPTLHAVKQPQTKKINQTN